MSQSSAQWWRLVSVEEIRKCGSRVEQLLDADLTDDASVIETMARAAALRHLVVSETTLPNLFDEASQRTASMKTSGATPAEVDAWLDKCVILEKVFKRTLEFVGNGQDGNLLALFEVFVTAAVVSRGINTSLAFSQGTTRPISVPPPRRLITRRQPL